MAVNMTGENYQAITDSLVLFFDGHKTVSAYARTDTLQRHDIASERTSYLEQVERDLKARLQQYYQHVEKSDYLVKRGFHGAVNRHFLLSLFDAGPDPFITRESWRHRNAGNAF